MKRRHVICAALAVAETPLAVFAADDRLTAAQIKALVASGCRINCWVDGKHQKFVLEADQRAGYVVVGKLDDGGSLYMEPINGNWNWLEAGHMRVASETRYGVVTLEVFRRA